MLRVLLALLPGIAAYVWFFGAAVLVQIALASITALLAEAAMLKMRGKPVMLFLGDGSALVTAWLIALTFPPIAPWWLTVVGVLAASWWPSISMADLGQNPFNPAMVAFALMIVAYPSLMSQWPAVGFTDFTPQQWQCDLRPAPARRHHHGHAAGCAAHRAAYRRRARHGGRRAGQLGHLRQHRRQGLGMGCRRILPRRLYLLQQRIITWHMPAAFLATLLVDLRRLRAV
jgi:electron transport complex protein RnfD